MKEAAEEALYVLANIASYWRHSWEKRAIVRNNFPDKVIDKRTGDENKYFVTCLVAELERIIKNNEDWKEVEERLESIRNDEMPKGLPSDGSRGQWRSSRNHKIGGLKWFINEYKE